MSQPLQGVKVVELARILAGPWAGQTLADLGADVIKVESPAGDDTRSWGPPFVKQSGARTASYFHACNRGKKSVTADFRVAEDLAFVKALVSESDIVIENFKVGGLAKFGLDYQALAKTNPGLIYCSITGFGQDGPYAHRAGYDYVIQGMSGLMSITGEPDGQPMKTGVAITDVFTGLYGAIGVLAALHERQATGKGKHLDLALLDVATAVTANQAMNYLTTGHSPGRLGNAHPNLMPYQVFGVSDGWVIIAVGNDGQFQRFCDLIARDDLAKDSRFSRNEDRVVNRDALTPILEAETRRFARDALLAACEQAGVPAGPINDMADVFRDPHIIHRGLKLELGGQPSVRSPIRYVGEEPFIPSPVPGLGVDNKTIKST